MEKALEDLSTYNGFNLYIDRPALLEEGVDLNFPVSLRVENVSLKSALNMILQQAKLTWIIKDEVLQVTTRRAGSSLPTRTYPVAKLLKGDLPGTGSPQDRLIKLITSTIEPR